MPSPIEHMSSDSATPRVGIGLRRLRPREKSLAGRAWRRIERLGEDSLLRNGIYIMGSTAVTSLLGFGFWVVAARVLSAEEVGRAAALISAMAFVSVFTNLGLGQVLVSRLASRATGHDWSITVSTSAAVAVVVSLIGGMVAAALLPTLVPALKGGLGVLPFLLMPVGVAAAACSFVLDFACIAERHAKHALVRNTVAAVIRLALIGGAAATPLSGTAWILIIWVGSFVFIDVQTVIRVLPSLGHDFRLTLGGWRRELVEVRGLIAGHQSINLGAQASTYLLPVIVSARLGPTQNAYFYTTFMVATSLFFIAPAIGNALFAEGAHHPERLATEVRRAVRQVALLAGPAALVLAFAGPLILGGFGPAYADAGDTLLLILIVSAVFDAVLQLALSVLRVRHRLQDAAIATWATLIVAIGSSWLLLAHLGLNGAGIGWGLGKVVGVCFAGVYLLLHRRAQRRQPLGD